MTKKYITKITPNQQRFIDNYCSHYGEWSATQCAISAGYEKSSAHTRASELLNWRLYPEVRKEIDLRLSDSRKVWEIDRNKSMANPFRIGQEAGAKGQYGVKAKCEQLRGQLAGLYIEKQMVLQKELTEEDIEAKWKTMFKTREEMEAMHKQILEGVWGKEDLIKSEIKKVEDEDIAEKEETLRNYNEDRAKQRSKGRVDKAKQNKSKVF